MGSMSVIRCVESKKYDSSGSILFIIKHNLAPVSTEIPISIEPVFSRYSLICYNVYPALVLKSVTVCD